MGTLLPHKASSDEQKGYVSFSILWIWSQQHISSGILKLEVFIEKKTSCPPFFMLTSFFFQDPVCLVVLPLLCSWFLAVEPLFLLVLVAAPWRRTSCGDARGLSNQSTDTRRCCGMDMWIGKVRWVWKNQLVSWKGLSFTDQHLKFIIFGRFNETSCRFLMKGLQRPNNYCKMNTWIHRMLFLLRWFKVLQHLRTLLGGLRMII